MSPELLFWSELILKMVMTAAVVVIVSITVERSGPFLGSLIAALPTAAGAAYVILAIEHPPQFIAASAIGSVASTAGVAIFAAIYAMLAQRHGLVASLGIALAIWFLIAAALRLVAWTPLTSVILNVVVFAVTIALCWRYRTAGPPRKFVRSALDIPFRAFASALVVAIVTTVSYSIGSFASGVFAVFPIVLCCSIVILHPRVGGPASASMLAHAQIALIGLWLGFLAVPLGSWWALTIGLAVCMAWSGVLWIVRRRRPAS